MFLLFPYLLPRIGFWGTIAACVLLTVVCFVAFAAVVKRFGIVLW
jgi:hypothetical protein